MFNVEILAYMEELVCSAMKGRRLRSRPTYVELYAMRNVLHTIETLMICDWPEDVCKSYIHDVFDIPKKNRRDGGKKENE